MPRIANHGVPACLTHCLNRHMADTVSTTQVTRCKKKKTELRLFESSYHLTTLFQEQRLYDHTIESCGKMDERPAEGTVIIKTRKTKNSEVQQLVA